MPTNIALTATATADSSFSGSHLPGKANDGNTDLNNSRWVSATQDVEHFLQLEWTQSVHVTDIQFLPSVAIFNEAFREYYLEYWNGTSWVLIAHVTGFSGEYPYITDHSGLNFNTTKIRMRLENEAVFGYEWGALVELFVVAVEA